MSASRPAWRSEEQQRRHFRRHHRELRVNTLDEYDESAYATIDAGTYFEFIDDDSHQLRVGYYDQWTERLTILSDDEGILISHFRCPRRYVLGRHGSTYT